ncbi:MAG: hypothetical protein KAR05_02635 [Candidatus Omnitrophica bacterium]|nr:hypothetical protein [Candidatus Omnitrophota bacterium]
MKEKEPQKKKPYAKPKVESREIYEVNALGCAKCPTAAQISLSIACIRGVKKYS